MTPGITVILTRDGDRVEARLELDGEVHVVVARDELAALAEAARVVALVLGLCPVRVDRRHTFLANALSSRIRFCKYCGLASSEPTEWER